MKPAAAQVGGNQGRMAGRRRAVGFLQLVPAKRRGLHSYETDALHLTVSMALVQPSSLFSSRISAAKRQKR